MRVFLIGLIAAASPLTPLAAAPPTTVVAVSPPQVDPAAIAAANRLLDAMDYDRLLDRTTSAAIAEAEKSIPARLEAASPQPIPDDLKAKLSTLIVNFMRRSASANRADVRKGVVLIYARHFTVAEIDHMVEMMHDPVMVKMQAQMPQIIVESMALGQASMNREMPRMMEELKAVIEDYVRNKGQKPAT